MVEKGYAPSAMKRVVIRCESASLPSMSLTTQEFMRYGYGSLETIPYNVSFEPVNLSFILDSQAEIYSFFYRWLNLIVNFNISGGIGGAIEYGRGDEKIRMNPYEVGYKQNYASKVYVLLYNEESKNIIEVTLHQAFPTSLSEVSLNWESQNEIVKLNVPINYRDFSVQTVDPLNLDQTSNILVDATVPGVDLFTGAVADAVNRGDARIRREYVGDNLFLNRERVALRPVEAPVSAPPGATLNMNTPGQFTPRTIR
jgi:hypothetical protein